MRLTKAEARVVAALDRGALLVLVGDEERMESEAGDLSAHYIVMETDPNERAGVAGTWRPQQRTLMGFQRRGLIEVDWP